VEEGRDDAVALRAHPRSGRKPDAGRAHRLARRDADLRLRRLRPPDPGLLPGRILPRRRRSLYPLELRPRRKPPGRAAPRGDDHLQLRRRDRLLSASSTSYSYDVNGNQLSAGSRTFAYDLANRLKQTTQGSTTTTYLYDGDGLRAQASTGAQANKKTNFLWDVNSGLPQLAQERDGAGSLLRRYTYGTHRISMTAGNSTSYYIRDGLGSTANLTSSNGATQWTWSYEPFGSIRTETKAGGNQPDNFMRFTGEYLDPTGLYHLRARQYDPAVGRFLTPDPAGQTVNESLIAAYAYVANRPTVLVDPSGETFQPSAAALVAIGAATTPAELVALPLPLIPDGGGGCAARPGYPLGVIGGFNGGVAAHTAKHGRSAIWQNRNAIDLNVPVGTAVCAIFKGRISATLGFGISSEGFRLHLVGATDTAFYTHLSRVVVRRAEPVERGQLLGYSGCGSEGVPHLHLALQRGNPDRYATPYRKPVNFGGCSRR
jgi:RHS repeat-associated protein